jgi:peptidoglycan/xylan/chitin deacetylase (PgdA/CDA1 family)
MKTAWNIRLPKGMLLTLVLLFITIWPLPQPKTLSAQGYVPMRDIPILMYHSISEGRDLQVPPADFEEQMRWLKEHGYTAITLGQLDAYWKGRYKVEGKPVVITFDDGYLDNYTVAWPILQKYQFPATIFVITDSIRLPHHMSWEQMREMHRAGIEFGSHMVHHSNFQRTPIERIAQELLESKRDLEKGLGSRVTTFCYPGGGLIPEAARLVKAAGYELAVTTRHKLASPDENPLLLSRLCVPGGMTLEQFATLFK